VKLAQADGMAYRKSGDPVPKSTKIAGVDAIASILCMTALGLKAARAFRIVLDYYGPLVTGCLVCSVEAIGVVWTRIFTRSY
jgi:hypothetical protein